MTKLSLSICIPTYNFGKFIGQTLDSIIPNLTEGVEVVILDGGSTDDTMDIVAQRQHKYLQIKYHRQEFRGGIDRDIAKVISFANGEYCWLFSADDIMMSGSVDKVLNYIQSHYDIYLCEHTLCDYEMHPIKEYPIFINITTPEIFDLGNVVQRKRYFSEARTSEAFFSFMSGPIFRRAMWEKAEGIPESFYTTCWALAGRFLSLVSDGLKVHYLSESLIYKRSGNDSFLEHGVVNRLRITVEGFAHISESIFGKESFENFHIKRVLRNERTLPHLLGIKLMVGTSTQQGKMAALNQIVFQHYSNAGINNMCKYIIFRIAPISILKIGLLFKNSFLKSIAVPKIVKI
jgi:abequosyltransferase